jgi:DNA-binding CsgD family transcriptional regulator
MTQMGAGLKPFITPPGSELTELLRAAQKLGFDRFLYTVESSHVETNYPLRVAGSGWCANYLEHWLQRIAQDPLRRMVARGELPLTNLPIVYENQGHSLSLIHRPLSAGETSLLEWCLTQGVKSGVSMAMRMGQSLYATANFYSMNSLAPAQQRAVTEKLFLIGHEAHARFEGSLPCSAINADVPKISARERECLQWMAQGKRTAEIAIILGISSETVRDHAKNIFRKLSTHGRAQAVARAYALGYLS